MFASAELIPVDPKLVSQFLPHVEHWLRAACEKTGASDWENDRQALESGIALLWIVWHEGKIHGAGTTEVVTVSGARHCYVTAFGGKGRKTWLHLIAGVEAYARRHGCKSVRTLARPGWARLLKDFRARLVLLEKELA
jgi:hypothetical protein